MLELEKFRFRNFMSYGDDWTEIPLGGLGQCLILGEIQDKDEDGPLDLVETRSKNSNGAGKSSIPNGILWTLFGRTMHSVNPGDKVRNWFTNSDCVGELTFKNGDMITRVRTVQGQTELFFVREGQDRKLVSDTLATTKLHQTMLNKEFGLDWNIFCGSVFFNQYGLPWLEMGDQTRKQALERMLHVDRFTLYAQVAKEKQDKVDTERSGQRKRLGDIDRAIVGQQESLRELQEQLDGFEANRESRAQRTRQEAASVASKRDSIELPDVEKLREKWGIVEQVKSKIAAMDKDASRVEREAYQAGAEARSFEKECQRMRSQIESWLQQSGKVCPQCEQEVEHTHIDTKIGPLKQEFAQLERNRIDHLTAVQKLQGQAEAMRTKQLIIEEKLVSMQPKMTVQEAGAIVRNWQYLDKQHSDLLVSAEQIAQEQNPHGSGMDRIHQRIAKLEEEKTKVTAEIENLGGLYQHLNYVNASYRDRKKIKSYVLSQRIPQLNARLAHYLDTFDLDLSLEFTNTLGISSDKWGYDFFCGGERKRVDIALMLAVFDLHEKMYGRQCNVVVLDEVDSRLDIGGVDSLVQIIKNDIAAKAETVLMISHRSTLVDLFPRHMTVKREGRLSRIDEIR